MSDELGVLDDLDDTRAALAEAKARIAEVKRERDQARRARDYGNCKLCERNLQLHTANARADAAEARIAIVRAEALEEAARVADKSAAWNNAALERAGRNHDRYALGARAEAEFVAQQIRALIAAGTSSCAAKDGEAGR